MNHKIIKNKKGLAIFIGIFAVFTIFTVAADLYLFPFSIKFILLSIIYIGVCFFSRRRLNSLRSLNLVAILTCCLTICIGIMFFINGAVMGIMGYICYGILYTFMVPFFLVSDIDEKTVIDIALNVTIFFNILTLIISFFIVPLQSDAQYVSIYGNANMLGIFLSVFTVAVLIKILKEKKGGYLILLSLDVVFILLSESRTTMLTFVVVVMLFAIFKLRTGSCINRTLIFRCLAVVILSLLLWNFSVFILDKVTPKIASSIEIGFSFDEKKTDDRTKHLFGKLSKGIGSDERFTSGRVEIWTTFIKNIDFTGHDNETIVFHTDIDGTLERDAHNSIIQLSYTSGFFAGICLLTIFIVGGIQVIRFLLRIGKNDYNEYNLYIVMMFTAYGVNSMFTAMYSFQHSIMSFFFWMLGIRIMNISVKKRGDTNEFKR